MSAYGMILLIMGVTGSGKSTVAEMLAQRLGWVFLEADDFHSAANKQKMHHGIALTDADRLPWLHAMHDECLRRAAQGKSAVLACSALRASYRQILMADLEVKLVYLRGSRQLIGERLHHRVGHFAGESILDDQFAVLEEPNAQEALVVDIRESPQEVVEEILRRTGPVLGS